MPTSTASHQGRFRRTVGLLLLIVALGAVLRVRGALDAFGFGWQHLSAHYGLIARNYLEHGVRATRFAQVINAESVPREQWVYFTHHPPGIALTAAASMSLWGDCAWAVRFPTLLFSILQIVVAFGLVREVAGASAALVAAALTAFVPCGAYYGILVCDLGAPVVTLSMLALWLDVRARKRTLENPASIPTIVTIAAAALFDWPALLVAGFIAARDLLEGRRSRALRFGVLILLLPLAHWLHVRWASGGAGRGASLLDSFLQHGLVGFRGLLDHFTLVELRQKLFHHWRTLFSVWSVPLVLAGSFALLRDGFRIRSAQASASDRERPKLALGTFLLGLCYTLPFARAVIVHEFWMLVFLPFVALASGVVCERLFRLRGLQLAGPLLLVVACAFSAKESWMRQSCDRTWYFVELGEAIQRHTKAGLPIFTNEKESECLLFYARRQIRGGFHDQDPRTATFLASTDRPLLPSEGWFCLLDPPVDPVSVSIEALRTFLDSRYESAAIPLVKTGSILTLYDFARPKDR